MIVDLKREVVITYLQNDVANPVTTINTVAYGVDDQTVSSLGTGRSPVGLVWTIDPLLGVGVELT